MFFQKELYPIVLRFFEMFSTCKAGIMPYAHGVLHMTKEDSIFSPDTVTDTAQNCPENIAKRITIYKNEHFLISSSRIYRYIHKGQIISKAIFVFLTSPKKRTKKRKKLTCYYYDSIHQVKSFSFVFLENLGHHKLTFNQLSGF